MMCQQWGLVDIQRRDSKPQPQQAEQKGCQGERRTLALSGESQAHECGQHNQEGDWQSSSESESILVGIEIRNPGIRKHPPERRKETNRDQNRKNDRKNIRSQMVTPTASSGRNPKARQPALVGEESLTQSGASRQDFTLHSCAFVCAFQLSL